MNYLQACSWVHSLKRIKKNDDEKLPLQRMKKLMEALGNPQKRLRFVHVAGTNGKGSTVVMLASILCKAGYKTGANISPYVLDFRERFLLNGKMIEEEELAKILNDVKKAVEIIEEPIIEFEAVTAAAFVYFEKNKCDIVCLETGIGGRLDPTNIVQNTLVACITQIGLDHTEMLGDNIRQIAAEKCGIIKHKCPVVCYPVQQKEAAAEILHIAKKANCALVVPKINNFEFHKNKKNEPFYNNVRYGGYELEIPFLGRHQALNASVVIEAALLLLQQGFIINDEHIVEGIKQTKFAGRIEVLSQNPLIMLDGAHNEDSAKALAKTLKEANLKCLNAVVGVLKDKQCEEIIESALPYIRKWYVVAPENPRAMPAYELANVIKKSGGVAVVCEKIDEAFKLAQQDVGNGVIVFGSLYLAASVLSLLK